MAEPEQASRIYIFDSSAWIAADSDPRSNVILNLLERLREQGQICSPREVFAELVRAGVYSAWAKQNRRNIGYPRRMNADYAANAGLVQHQFPGMGGALSPKNRADPWVVAVALTEIAAGRDCCVVTTETADRRPNRKIKGVCASLGIPCLTIDELVEISNGW